MATEFNDSQHYGFFMTGTTLTSATGKYIRQSELVLASLRAQGILDNMIDSTTAPATDKLWLDKNTDPAVLKEWDSIGSAWVPMTFERLFGRAIVTVMATPTGTGNAVVVAEPDPFIPNRLYSLTPIADNSAATTIQVTGVGTYAVKYTDGSDIDAQEFKTGKPTILLFTGGRFEVLFAVADIYAIRDQVVAISAMFPAIAANTMLVDNAAGTARETKTFAEVRALIQPYSANTMLVDNAAGTARENKPFDEVRELLAVPVYVTTRTALKALATTDDAVAILLEPGRVGVFKWTSGDFSSQIAADTQEGVYVKANAIASASGAWVRAFNDELDPLWFGAVGDGTTNDSAAITGALALGIKIDGFGRTYNVTSAPSSYASIKNAAFKVGSVTHVSRDFLRTDTAKITDGLLYTGWPEDKAYLVGDQIRVWANEKESHADGTARIVLYFSDDGGASFSHGEYLDLGASGRTLWCAGFSGTTEYLIVRVPSGSTDVAPFTYERWTRTITLGAGTGEFNGAWSSSAISFTTPSGFTGDPVMVISFTTGHSSSIVVGLSYGEGAAVARSTDGGANWTSYILATGTDYEEPSVKYDSSTQRYYGFMRNGGTGNPIYWHSAVDDLSDIDIYTAPSGTFGTNGMGDSNVPLVIRSGRIYAFGSYRTGTLEGAASDETTSAFYMDMPVTAGNIWTQATTKIYRLGTLPHREGAGAASAVGVGSIVTHEDKLHLFYGMEERTGVTSTLNRVANIYQTVIFLSDLGTMFDFRADLVANRSAGPLRKMVGGNKGFLTYIGDASSDYPGVIGGRPNFAVRTASHTIATGVVTLSTRQGHYFIDTEASAATDDLDTITDANAIKGDVIVLSAVSSSRDVVVKNGTGNIVCGADRTLTHANDRIGLEYNGTNWIMLYFADNAA